mgnify:FL=1
MKNDSVWAHLDAFLFRVCDPDSVNYEILKHLMSMNPHGLESAEKIMLATKWFASDYGQSMSHNGRSEGMLLAAWVGHLVSRAMPWTIVEFYDRRDMHHEVGFKVHTNLSGGAKRDDDITDFVYATAENLRIPPMDENVMRHVKATVSERAVAHYGKLAATWNAGGSTIRVISESPFFGINR